MCWWYWLSSTSPHFTCCWRGKEILLSSIDVRSTICPIQSEWTGMTSMALRQAEIYMCIVYGAIDRCYYWWLGGRGIWRLGGGTGGAIWWGPCDCWLWPSDGSEQDLWPFDKGSVAVTIWRLGGDHPIVAIWWLGGGAVDSWTVWLSDCWEEVWPSDGLEEELWPFDSLKEELWPSDGSDDLWPLEEVWLPEEKSWLSNCWEEDN